MAVLTAVRAMQRGQGVILAYKLAASTKVFAGALVNLAASGGWAKNATDTASEKLVGVADKTADNTSGANGAKKVRVYKTGVFRFFGSGFVQGDVGLSVYVSDNQTVAKSTTNSVLVGTIVEVISATEVYVQIKPAA
jgi:hypothetical protein